MGFGSYSESEREQQAIDTSEMDIQDETRVEFEGAVAFDPGTNTGGLLTQLNEIKDKANDESEHEG